MCLIDGNVMEKTITSNDNTTIDYANHYSNWFDTSTRECVRADSSYEDRSSGNVGNLAYYDKSNARQK